MKKGHPGDALLTYKQKQNTANKYETVLKGEKQHDHLLK